jgi:hypothetical protein
MSTATKERITRLVAVDEEGVTLRLTLEEAYILSAVCNRIGGDNVNRHVFSDRDDSILSQLRAAGVATYDYTDPLAKEMTGRISF